MSVSRRIPSMPIGAMGRPIIRNTVGQDLALDDFAAACHCRMANDRDEVIAPRLLRSSIWVEQVTAGRPSRLRKNAASRDSFGSLSA